MTRSQDGGLLLGADQVCVRPDGDQVYFTAAELGANGRDMLGRNIGLWSVPADGSARPQRLTDAETIHLVRGAAITATPAGVLVTAESRGAMCAR